MKKIISVTMSLVLTFNTMVLSASSIIGTPVVKGGGANIECVETDTSQFYPMGDLRGHNVLTKKEVSRECVITKQEYGKCLKWEENKEFFSLAPTEYNSYESNNYSDALGSLLSAIGAYDQIEHLWSGWHGYCEIGTKSNFDWAKDPMFWASMAMSFAMSSTSGDGFLKESALGEFINSGTEAVGNAMGSLFESSGSTFIGEAAKDAGIEAVAQAGEVATDLAYQQGISTFYQGLGRCAVNAGFSATQSLYEFANDNESDSFECDPVDEICDNTTSVQDESDVITMDETQFNDIVEKFAQEESGLNVYDYVIILDPSPQNGIVSLRMKNMNEMSEYSKPGQGMEELEKLKNDMKSFKLALNVAMTAGSLYSCMSGVTGGMGQSNSPGNSSGGESDQDRASVRSIGGAAMDFGAKFMGPYGAVFSAVMKISLFVATSFQSIDTCYNEDDAQEAGKRAERTQSSLSFNLCHLVDVECAEKAFMSGIFGGGCALDGYKYCCYDQLMSKILVEQLKAQLGRDWAHCTGISLRDLNFISFQQCTDSQMKDGSTIDGAHQVGVYDYKKAFQYKYKCIDMTEFKQYLNTLLGDQIDTDDFNDFWNDITEQGIGAI